jgi:hypothetical protein
MAALPEMLLVKEKYAETSEPLELDRARQTRLNKQHVGAD